MEIALEGQTVALIGERNPIADAALMALLANGGREEFSPTLLIVSLPLLPLDTIDIDDLLADARAAATRMASGGSGGRIVFLLSAAANLPMRRHPRYSSAMATAFASMRVLAMEFAPMVLVNAVGVGAIGDPPLAGDGRMLRHASISRPGKVEEIVDAVLFFCDPANTYTTGQMLSVDGGWSVGYGRSF